MMNKVFRIIALCLVFILSAQNIVFAAGNYSREQAANDIEHAKNIFRELDTIEKQSFWQKHKGAIIATTMAAGVIIITIATGGIGGAPTAAGAAGAVSAASVGTAVVAKSVATGAAVVASGGTGLAGMFTTGGGVAAIANGIVVGGFGDYMYQKKHKLTDTQKQMICDNLDSNIDYIYKNAHSSKEATEIINEIAVRVVKYND